VPGIRPPRLLAGSDGKYREIQAVRKGLQHMIDLPPRGAALLIWERIK
jgi:hypothetical protein